MGTEGPRGKKASTGRTGTPIQNMHGNGEMSNTHAAVLQIRPMRCTLPIREDFFTVSSSRQVCVQGSSIIRRAGTFSDTDGDGAKAFS
jgi:hypothetical protein